LGIGTAGAGGDGNHLALTTAAIDIYNDNDGVVDGDDDDKPDACVSLLIHPDAKCIGEPKETLTFPTWTKPGSPCYTDDKMFVSVKDQYCNTETGNWHQTVYPKKEESDCTIVPWWESWIFPQDQTFTTDNCIAGLDETGAIGFSLKSCSVGPCGDGDGDAAIGRPMDDDPDTSFEFAFVRGLRGY